MSTTNECKTYNPTTFGIVKSLKETDYSRLAAARTSHQGQSHATLYSHSEPV